MWLHSFCFRRPVLVVEVGLVAHHRVEDPGQLASEGDDGDPLDDIIDIGGESTRPGAAEVPVAEEIARTAPVIEALAKRFEMPANNMTLVWARVP